MTLGGGGGDVSVEEGDSLHLGGMCQSKKVTHDTRGGMCQSLNSICSLREEPIVCGAVITFPLYAFHYTISLCVCVSAMHVVTR